MHHEQTVAAGVARVSLPEGRLSFLWTVTEDIDMIGHMALYVHMEIQGATDALLFAGLRKFSQGAEVTFEGSYGFSEDMVSKGWQRAAHRELDAALSTVEQPVYTHSRVSPLKPKEIVPIAISMRPHATRMRKGDQLRLDIQGRWFYPKSKFGGQFPASYEKSGEAICTFHTGAEHPAYLLMATRASIAGSGRQR
jgi:predicted acyl esterase